MGACSPRKILEIWCSEIASKAILGQMQSRSSYMAHGVLYLSSAVPVYAFAKPADFEFSKRDWQNSRSLGRQLHGELSSAWNIMHLFTCVFSSQLTCAFSAGLASFPGLPHSRFSVCVQYNTQKQKSTKIGEGLETPIMWMTSSGHKVDVGEGSTFKYIK